MGIEGARSAMRFLAPLAICVFALLTANTVEASGRLKPKLMCVEDNNDGTYTAHFFVTNTTGEARNIPIGWENRFSPGDWDRGQATEFSAMRVTPQAAVVTWDGSPIEWKLNGYSAKASKWSNHCDCPGHIIIEPAEATLNIGEEITVTATVFNGAGDPLPGVEIIFDELPETSVNDIYHVATSDANGQATFTYSSQIVGHDTIDAFVEDACIDLGLGIGTTLGTWCEAQIDWVCEEERIRLTPNGGGSVVGEEHTVTATVTRRSDDEPIEGRIVHFELIGDSANSGSADIATDADGKARFTYVGTAEGGDWILAEIDTCDGIEKKVVDHWWKCPHIDIELAPEFSGGTIGDEHTVTATVTSEGNPLEGVTVRFETLPGSANDVSGDVVTDAMGEAHFTYVGVNIGTDTIKAEVDDACEGDTVKSERVYQKWDCPVESIVLTPPTSEGPIGTTHTILATVTDEGGDPVEGRLVLFEILAGSANSGSGMGTTDVNGQATFAYIGENLGTDTIQATIEDCDGDVVPSNTVTRKWECPEEVITLAPASSQGEVGETHTVVATVTRTDTGDPLEGRTVFFQTLPGSANDASGSSVTDASGQASFSYVGANVGVDSIEAEFSTCSGTTAKSNRVEREWVCPVVTVSLAPATSSGPIGTEHTVTATVLDGDSNPVAGETVMFMTLAGSANSASGSGVTDASGQASFSYIGENLGTDTIQATIEDCDGATVPSNTVTREWECPEEAITLAPESSQGEIGETHTVVATVTRTDTGDPLEGRTVFFQTLPGSANDASGSSVTDASGQASFSYVGANVGVDSIEAEFSTCSGTTAKSNRVEREWSCPIVTVDLAPPTSSGPIGTEHTVTATVLDGDSNPIVGETVMFTTLAGSANSASGADVTDASGMATFSYVAENLGDDFIAATVLDCAGVEVASNTVIREWTCPPEAIDLAPPTSEGPLGTEHIVTATLTRTDTGDPLEGRTVTFMTLPGSANDASGSSVTDASGVATFAYIGENTGVDTIQATFSNCDGATVNAEVERSWTCPVETIELGPLTSTGPVGTEHTVTATVRDGDDQPVAGRLVLFELLPGSANTGSGSSKTDLNGEATFTYTGENEGDDTIVASIVDCDGDEVVSNVVLQTWDCPLEELSVTVEPEMPSVGMPSKIKAFVMTQGGEPVEGRVVTFEFLPGSVNSGVFTDVTGPNGKAAYTYTSELLGEDFIRVSTVDCAGREISVEVEVLWAECWLWIGKKKDNTPLTPPDQDIRLVKKLKFVAAVLEDDIPTLTIPMRPSLVGKHVYAQVYMLNDIVFPDDPVQTSNGLDITIGADAIPVPYGPEFGIDLWAEMPAIPGEPFTVKFDVRGM